MTQTPYREADSRSADPLITQRCITAFTKSIESSRHRKIPILKIHFKIEVRSPAGAKDFSSNLCPDRLCGPTQPPVQWVPGVLSPGVKRDRSVTLTTHPHLMPRSRMSRSYTSLPAAPPWCVVGLIF
jgi:hypothetical protein